MKIKKFEQILAKCSLGNLGLEYRKERESKIKHIIDISVTVLFVALIATFFVGFVFFWRDYLYLNFLVIGILYLFFINGISNTKLKERIIRSLSSQITTKDMYLYIHNKIPYIYIKLASKYENISDPFLSAYPEYWKTLDSYKTDHKRRVETMREISLSEFKKYENEFYKPYLELIKSIETFLNLNNLPRMDKKELYTPKLQIQYCDKY